MKGAGEQLGGEVVARLDQSIDGLSGQLLAQLFAQMASQLGGGQEGGGCHDSYRETSETAVHPTYAVGGPPLRHSAPRLAHSRRLHRVGLRV